MEVGFMAAQHWMVGNQTLLLPRFTEGPNQVIEVLIFQFHRAARHFWDGKKEVFCDFKVLGSAEELKHEEIGMRVVGKASTMSPVDEMQSFGRGFGEMKSMENGGL